MSGRLRLGVLISGSGSNLQALIDACADPAYPAEIALVISNVAEAHGVERARRAGLPVVVLPHRNYASRDAFEAAIHAALCAHSVGLVCLAGFMRVLTAGFVEAWQGRMINIHPSLLPAFKGLHTHQQALDAGVRLHGCTVHFVEPALDDGPIVAQAAVPVAEDDTVATLAARVLAQEHRLYPLAVRLIALGRVTLAGRQVKTGGGISSTAALLNPGP